MTSMSPETDLVPVATEATPDLLCWLWAALPPRNGRIHVASVASLFQVSDSTVRRWLKRSHELEWTDDSLRLLIRRANLRGHGDFLWPPLDEASRRKRAVVAADARVALQVLRVDPGAGLVGARVPHVLYQVYYPKARVFGVAYGSTPDTPRKLRRVGVILDEVEVANRHVARLVIASILDLLGQDCVIPPRSLLPTGRTQTWLRRAGTVDLDAMSSTVVATLNQRVRGSSP